ncbi:MAG: class I SAM-dependent DNA methyltransferase [Lachnospiraceae bacterium]|nr:class I SAM-dependent DNA methyltransferase [Lachnospiraceae bacterium]
MTDAQCRTAARQFAADWAGRGDEKQETQAFWLALLQKVYGVEEPEKYIAFELPVKLDHTSFIDGYIADTRVLIEQKGRDIDLSRGYKQSDGSVLTPFQQARRYAGYLPHDQNPRWIVVCNFQEFRIHDMNRPNDEPEILKLADLEKEYHRLQFLVDTGSEHIKKEMEISLQAGELVGVLYDALLKQYKDPSDPETLKSLNKLCVRLVFCLYAEDAGIFGSKSMFHDYLEHHRAEDRRALINLFHVLDQDIPQRDKYLDDDLAAFPYVNGGLFADEEIEIPRLGDEIIDLILRRASEDFDWSAISPTIFGAVFESTLNPETRRSGGMHYTSIENIHKLIDPLFLDGLKAEFAEIEAVTVEKTRKAKLEAFQKKLAGLKFLDPACGSGNFLTETYISLRRLENQVIALLNRDQIVLDMGNPIQVSIGQFYGIEINDFAVTVAKTALWIAESQMMKATEDVVRVTLDFLPLRSYANITEGNALRLDWESVVPKWELNYIMGNPPFVGQSVRSKQQSDDMGLIWGKGEIETKLDYVICWYKKALDFMNDSGRADIKAAFVSTNSICQGESVPTFWKRMMDKGASIFFAYRTFIWDSEANDKAAVHCVIIGFTNSDNSHLCKKLFDANSSRIVQHINPYLYDAPDMWITNRVNKPQNGLPKMTTGSPPTDDGALTLTVQEKADLEGKYPILCKYIKPFIGAKEFLHDKLGSHSRYCLWFQGGNPSEYVNIGAIKERLLRVKKLRESSNADRIQKMASYPYLFCQIRQPKSTYLVFPRHSSQNRRYIPIGFVSPNIIAGDACSIIPDVTIYEFGILTSNVHNAWMRVVCGRIKSDFRYSPSVYNNFPWPTPTDAQKAKIEQTAQAILDARALYPDSSLADLYDETTMPPELRRAHQQNDRAVMQAYGFSVKDMTESQCVAELMKMYQELTRG